MASLEEQSANKPLEESTKDAKELFNRGIKYFDRKEFDEAISLFTQAIQIDHLFSEAYFRLGECYKEKELYDLARNNHDLAINYFNGYIDADSELADKYCESYIEIGRHYENTEEYNLAIECYTKIINFSDVKPSGFFMEAHFSRSRCYAENKQYDLAIKYLDEAMSYEFPCAESYLIRFKYNINIKPINYKSALDDLDKAIEYSNYPEDKNEIARKAFIICLAALRDTEKAKSYLAFINEKDKYIYLLLISETKNSKKKDSQIQENIKDLENIKNRMQKLVEQFTHSLGNVIFPDTIYQVAERLKNNPECRKDVLLLHEAYHSEIIIKLQGELLRQRYTNTNPEKFRQFIRSCRRTPNSAENTKSIEDILDYAASRVTARFLNQHYAGLNSIRDKMLSKKNLNLDALKQKFEDDILLNKSLRPIAWINQNLRPVQITAISPLWQKVCLLSESHAEALLFGYFSEILFNAFKYADHDKDEFLRLDFDEKTINNKTYLTCNWLNPVKDKSPAMLGTGKGLDAIQEDLKQLNDTAYPEESLLISQQNNQFQVTLFFKKDLLVNDLPSLKIKRKANVE